MGSLRRIELQSIYNHFKNLRVTTKVIELQCITSKSAEKKSKQRIFINKQKVRNDVKRQKHNKRNHKMNWH